ncbi:SusC/RagA family TonB-linked outer membrane protein [Mangrovibacterium diazotrophicum]|uniref:TonB-linked SusC/RagA family outer membrane protein n=1 Tax=Mangrovibacterium diazotrophicum TaxID=1261403 RepID=A0A419W9D7_9BACT|nr:SusC/RagA family TonB-linked outer membrane protein [Mangrovibacterium diazotrophicum]RKD92024.1 TonB-linked SusC/RagA family outer membrane protein [Mangrovibacterium diazotrophicum]
MNLKVNWLRKCLTLLAAFFLGVGALLAQEVNLSGIVTSSEDGSPLPGVSVLEKGTNHGTVTNVDGQYSISVPQGATVVFSFIGMEIKEITASSSQTLDVVLDPETEGLGEVVVTALGITREKKSLGYSVAEVGSDEVATVKDVNPMNSLSGRVAGVTITQGSFGPGSSSRVVIRGNNSITGNNQPLYVVDGIPMSNSGYGSANGSDTGEYSKSDYGSGISDINPDDIASISVLKGPNAAALYGSRAANGVIMITTKKGSARKGVGVTFTSNTTFESPMLLPDYQNEYGQGTEGYIPSTVADLKSAGGSWGPRMDGSNQLYYTGETKAYSPQPDNVKDFFETGSTLINTLALTAGNDEVNVRFSYTNTEAQATIPNSKIQRHNFNLRGFAKLTDRLSVDAKATYFKQYGKNRPTLGTEGLMSTLYNIPRNVDINDYKTYQDPETLSSVSATSLGANPYWSVYHDQREDWKDRLQGFAKIQYDFTDYLSAYVRVGTDMSTMNIETVNQYGHWYSTTGAFSYTESQEQETNADFLLMFKKDLTDKINLNASLGGNHMYSTNRGHSVSGSQFRIPDGPPLSAASVVTAGFTPLEEKEINSLYGTVSFAYDRWFYLDLSARNDWSSTLPETNWSYFYPSASASILINDLLEIENSVLSYSKVRASWAQVGNDTDPYQLYDTYSLAAASSSYLGETTMSRSDVKYASDLKPEDVRSIEIGGEFHFFNDRLYTDMSYYDITSKDLIMNVPISKSTGYSYMKENVGEIRNKGFEMMLGGVPVKTDDFTWDVSVNFATNKNKLNELIEGTDDYTFSTINSGNVIVKATVGGGFGDIYGTTWEKDDDGNILVLDNGKPQVSSDKVLLGNYQPDWTGGMTNTFSYKNWKMSFLIDARFGGEVYSGTDAAMDAAGTSKRTLAYREGGVVVDGMLDDGSANATSISAEEYWGAVSSIASEYVYDQTNVRLREISLIWNLPSKWLENTIVRNASIGVIGRNLFFFYKDTDNFDPEASYSVSSFSQGVVYYPLPTSRSIGFNLNVNF